MENFGNEIGYIIDGSLKDGLTARLLGTPDTVREGSFVVTECGTTNYYGLVTDVRLGAVDPRFTEERSVRRLSPNVAEILKRHTLYSDIEIMPTLMQNVGTGLEPNDTNVDLNPLPVKTVPTHRSPVRIATAFDVAQVFGSPDDGKHFALGTTREMGHPVAVELKKLVERSSGIFGATGSGKSYLTRMILAGLIIHKTASVLVLDMHSEYAFGDTSPDSGFKVPGLKDKLGNRVKVVALGKGTNVRGGRTDFDLVLEEDDITPEDILMLAHELNLRETTAATLSALESSYHEQWLGVFMNMDLAALQDWADANHINQKAAEALQGKLARLKKKPYIVPAAPTKPVDQIINVLKSGNSVMLSFGQYDSDLDYLLVANILTRKVREAWEKQTNDFESGRSMDRPIPLVVAVEEAHKLLSPEMAGQTAFGQIAREMRKYSVTLLVIDQRPSKIYDEVMSQLGTRITGWLGDEADISAVLSGLAGKDSLRGMLSRLQPKQEILMLGYGVPMPMPLASRRYNEGFWADVLKNEPQIPSFVPKFGGDGAEDEDDFLSND